MSDEVELTPEEIAMEAAAAAFSAAMPPAGPKFAARLGDLHICPMVTGIVPHVGGPIAAGFPQVMIGGMPAARQSDMVTCVGPPDSIMMGSLSVKIGGMAAARFMDPTVHGGMITIGCPTVIIGDVGKGRPLTVLGNPAAGMDACNAAAGGRDSGSTQQSYQNCGVESVRQIINQVTGESVDEDTLLDEAMDANDADREATRADSGGTSPASREDILARHGVDSSQQDATLENILNAVGTGRGVITSHDVSVLWGPGNSGGHAILVTGVEFDEHGQPETFITNDTGTGTCGARYPADVFMASLRPGRPVNVTDEPIW
ncbi:MAG: PAAR domain-containing protein [Pirellulaceae bacterium]